MPLDESFLADIINRHTRRSYKSVVNLWLAWCEGNERPADQDSLLLWSKEHYASNMGSQNVARCAGLLWLRHAGKPIEKVRMLGYQAPMQPVIDVEREYDAALALASNPRDRALIAVLRYTLLRWEGTSNLLWGHVDWVAKEAETIEKRGIRRSKDSKSGPVILTDQVLSLLEAYWSSLPEPKPRPNERVFPITYERARQIVKRAFKEPMDTGKRGKALHSIRRGAATALLKNMKGTTPQELLENMEVLRHALTHSTASMSTKYLYFDRTEQRKKFEDAMRGKPPPGDGT